MIKNPPKLNLSHLGDIIAGWERAEGIRILHLWITDAGDWRVEWHERSRRRTDFMSGTENHIKVSRLIADLKGALKGRYEGINHIACPRPGTILAWTSDGQYFRWSAPEEVPV